MRFPDDSDSPCSVLEEERGEGGDYYKTNLDLSAWPIPTYLPILSTYTSLRLLSCSLGLGLWGGCPVGDDFGWGDCWRGMVGIGGTAQGSLWCWCDLLACSSLEASCGPGENELLVGIGRGLVVLWLAFVWRQVFRSIEIHAGLSVDWRMAWLLAAQGLVHHHGRQQVRISASREGQARVSALREEQVRVSAFSNLGRHGIHFETRAVRFLNLSLVSS